MQNYIGVKLVKAMPMTVGQFNIHMDNERTSVEESKKTGYLVEYDTGYQSWCPKQQFDEANRLCDAMTFGHAIEAMKQGKKVARAGWNGKDMFIYYVLANEYKTTTEVGYNEFGNGLVKCGAYICMKPANGPLVIGWLASQTDMLAEDWQIVD